MMTQADDTISRKALIDYYESQYQRAMDDPDPVSGYLMAALHTVIDHLKTFPSAGAMPVKLRVEIDKDDFEDWETAQERGWYRKRFYCPCGQLIKAETWEKKPSGKEHCFGSGTILQENKMPKYCPECGRELKWEEDYG